MKVLLFQINFNLQSLYMVWMNLLMLLNVLGSNYEEVNNNKDKYLP